MSDREQRVREIAYLLWEEEGYPDGQAERHWVIAESMLDGDDEDGERKQTEGEPPGEAAETPTEAAPAKRRKAASNG